MDAPSKIHEQPHYEVSSAELATWVEQQGANTWWSIGEDRYLSSRLSAQCRGDELANVLRRANRTLLVHDPLLRPDARGQTVTATDINSLTIRTDPAIFESVGQPVPGWANDRYLWLCWSGERNEWTLTEDSEATRAFRDVITEPLIIR
jgi:hypothetical protein